MSAIKLSTPSSGSISLSPANTASNLTITVPAVTGTMLTTASAGAVLQVVNATYTTYTTTTSSSFVDTGLSASITPTSASNKILCFVNLSGIAKAIGNGVANFQLVRNSTSILNFERFAGYNATTTESGIGSVSTSYLDSPSTTSATTYKIQFAADGASVSARINNYNNAPSSISTITLMEIAA